MKIKLLLLLVFFSCTHIDCDTNTNTNTIIGCWESENGYVNFYKNGFYQIGDSICWKYKIVNDSLIKFSKNTFDQLEQNKPTRIVFLDNRILVLYDSLFSKSLVFTRCHHPHLNNLCVPE